MSVTPVEVESVTPPTGPIKPKPVYADENVTVYSIPLFPKVDEDRYLLSESQEGPSSKRKRQASPASPPRKSRDEEFSVETENLPLKDRMLLNGFLPTNLVGKDADEWREMAIKNMFPAGNSESGKGGDEDLDVDASTPHRHPGSFNGSVRQLPRMNLTKNSEPITPHQKPSLAYIVIGPKTRGKFDAKKANELGLAGKLRGLVAGGTTVTFTTTNADGKEIERTVSPEECVGSGENPAVCPEIDWSFFHQQLIFICFRLSSFLTSPLSRIYQLLFLHSRNQISTPSSGRGNRKTGLNT